MQTYQQEFLDFALEKGVLRFGEFVLKSGRLSPYFFNAGLFNSGAAVARLGLYYAQAIKNSGIGFDMLFGPAYKGIPLATATVAALYELYRLDIPFAFNRKEAKDHGEGGIFVGAPVKGRVLVIDDVISAGTSVRESVSMIESQQATLAGVAIALDRQERGTGSRSAIQEVEESLGVKVVSIVNLAVLIAYLENKPGYEEQLEKMLAYRRQYGVQ